ncbi:MAG: hypothetical protein AB8C95_00490, partial [Phycisphaeraceae bacterium]
MLGQTDTIDQEQSGAPGWTWLSRLAIAWITGILIAAQWPSRLTFVLSALLALSVTAVLIARRQDRAARIAGLLAFALVGGVWLIVQRDY